MGGERSEQARGANFPDHSDALRVLRAGDDAEKSRILEEIGAHGRVERQLMTELARKTPVRRPDDFQVAHRNLVLAVEVLDRNGGREVTLPPALGPLRPVLAPPVQLVTRWIAKSHVNVLASSVRRLYERREASAVRDSPEEHQLLRRAPRAWRGWRLGFGQTGSGCPLF